MCVQGTNWRGGECWGHVPYLDFCSRHPVFAPVGIFFIFLYLLSIICPNCLCMQLFFVPYNFVFCCSRRFVQMLALQQRVLGPGVSAGLFSCALRHVTSSSFCIGTSSWWLWSGHTLFYVRANGQVCQCQHVCTEHVCSAPLLEILLSAMRTAGPPYSAIFRKKKHR